MNRRTGSSATALLAGLVCFGLGRPGYASARQQPAPAGFAYLVGFDGHLTKIRLADRRVVAHRMLVRDMYPGTIAESQDAPGVEGVAGGPGMLVFLHAIDSTADPEAPRRYQLTAVTLPALTLAGIHALPRKMWSAPRLAFDPARKRVLLEWSEDDPADTISRVWTVRLASLRLPDLKPLRQWTAVASKDESPPVTAIPLFSDPCCGSSVLSATRFGPDSTLMHNRHNRIRLLDSAFDAVFPALALTPEQVRWGERATAGHYSPPARGYGPIPVDGAGPRTLWAMTVDSTRARTSLFMVQELGADSAGVTIEVPHSTGWLTGQGGVVVVEQIDGPPNRGTSFIRKTGTIRLFDAQSGKQLARVTDLRLAGTFEGVRMLCASDDGRLLIFKNDKFRVLLVEPWQSRVRVAAASAIANYGSACFLQPR